jgi:hypothetical protein
VKIRRASPDFHFSSCGMLAWIRPMRMGVPVRVSEPSAIQHGGCRGDRHCAAAARGEHGVRNRRIDECHERRDTVDADDARHLRDRQHRDLTVAEQHPREAAEHHAPEELRRDPRRRRQEHGHEAASRDQPARKQRKQRREEPLVEREEHDTQRRRRQRDAAEGANDRARPVERSHEVDESRRQAEEERPERRLSSPLDCARGKLPTERHQQRNQCNPRTGRMSVTGKTQREQRARHERQRVVEADDHSKSRVSD